MTGSHRRDRAEYIFCLQRNATLYSSLCRERPDRFIQSRSNFFRQTHHWHTDKFLQGNSF